MTFRHVLLTALLLAPLACSTTPPHPLAQAEPTLIDESAASRATASKLQSPAPKLGNISFEKAINSIAHAAGVKIFVNWAALESAAVDKDTALNIDTTGLSCRQAIDRIFDVQQRLAFAIDDGSIVLSTADHLDRKYLAVQAYDVQDLLLASNQPRSNGIQMPQFGLGRSSSSGSAEGSGGPGLFGPNDAPTINALVSLIANTVEPKSWQAVGDMPGDGDLGSIREYQGQLIVKQTPRAHAQIARILADQRRSFLAQISIQELVIALPAPIETYMPEISQPRANGHSPDFLDEALVEKLRTKVLADPKATVLSAPRTMVLNGQSTHLASDILVSDSQPPATAPAVLPGPSLGFVAAHVPGSNDILIVVRVLNLVPPQVIRVYDIRDLTTQPAPATTPSTTSAPGGIFGPSTSESTFDALSEARAPDLRILVPSGKYAILGGLPRNTTPQTFTYTLITAHPVARPGS